MDLDDIVDVPKQPKIKDSFFWILTKRETLYLAFFLGLAFLTIRIPMGLVLNTFVFGIVLLIGLLFTVHKFKGRNFDRWFYDYLSFKIRTFKRSKMVYDKQYKFELKLQTHRKRSIWQQVLITMPLFGPMFLRHLDRDYVPEAKETEEFSEEIFSTFNADFDIEDIEEQIKGILNVHFFYDWQKSLKDDNSLEYADPSRLLVLLDKFIEEKLT